MIAAGVAPMWWWLACSIDNRLRPDPVAPESGDTAEIDTAVPDDTDVETADTGVPDTDEPVDTGVPEVGCEAPFPAVPADDCLTAARVGIAAFDTIQAAIDAAADGDVVTVCPGVHTEALAVTRPLSMTGYGPTLSTITGRLVATAPLTVSSLVFADGASTDGGGAISAGEADLCLLDVSFRRNRAHHGGAVAFEGAATLTIAGGRFERNRADEHGGALYVSDGALVGVRGATVADNEAGAFGGGVFVDWSVAATLTGTEIRDNRAREGGGVGLAGGSAMAGLVLDQTVITRNDADIGGGLASEGRDHYEITLVDSAVTDNSAVDGGGGILLNSVGGEHLVATRTLFEGNESLAGNGGAISVTGQNAEVVDLLDCTLDNNEAGAGGAISLLSTGRSRLTVTGGAITSNDGPFGGGGVLVGKDARLDSVDVDWGFEADDNTPDDVVCGEAAWTFGAGATFSCEDGICG